MPLKVYKGTVTTGETDGILLTESGQGNPLLVRLSASANEVSAPITLAIRRDPEEIDASAVTLSLEGTAADRWALSLDGVSFGSYGASLVLPAEVTDVNTLFFVRARAVSTDQPNNDYSVRLKAQSGVDSVYFQLCRQVYTTINRLEELSYTMEAKTLTDMCSATVLKDIQPKSRFEFNLGDLPVRMMVRTVTKDRSRRRIDLTYDFDELYSRPIAITNKTKASEVIAVVASAFGKTLHWHADDFDIEPVDDGSTYRDVLSRLFGWTDYIPHQLVSVFVRGDHLWVVQRGKEPTVRDLGEHGEVTEVDTYESGILTFSTDNESNPTTSFIQGERGNVYLSGTYSFGGANVSFSNGLVTQSSRVSGGVTEVTNYSYNRSEPPALLTGETTYITEPDQSRSIVKTYSYSTYTGVVFVSSEYVSETITKEGEDEESKTILTRYYPLGQGMFARVVDVDGKRSQSDVQRGAPAGEASPVVVDQWSMPDREVIEISGRFSGDSRFVATDTTTLNRIAAQIEWRNKAYVKRLSCKAYGSHIYDFSERIRVNGVEYHLERNRINTKSGSMYEQSLELVRWYQ